MTLLRVYAVAPTRSAALLAHVRLWELPAVDLDVCNESALFWAIRSGADWWNTRARTARDDAKRDVAAAAPAAVTPLRAVG